MAALTATLHELSAPHSVLLVSMVNATAVAKAQVIQIVAGATDYDCASGGRELQTHIAHEGINLL